MKRAALITVHGMGSTPADYNTELRQELQRRLKARYERLYVGSVFYQGILEPNERRIWERLARKVRWDDLRKFLLFGFADAAGLEANKELQRSVYTLAQLAFARELYLAFRATAQGAPVVFIAQSLGGQVLSCYFWDAIKSKHAKVNVGIWQDIQSHAVAIAGNEPLTSEALAFLRGESLRVLFTTGCNIPIFVAAHAAQDVKPIRPNERFVWKNYYDKDDVLGWPLADLSDEYAQVVRDHAINAGGGLFGWITRSWNPLSHGQYWRDDDVLDPLEAALRDLLG